MSQWNRNELLIRLNKQVMRIYKTTTLSGIVLFLTILISVMFIPHGYGFVCIVAVLLLYINYRRVLNDAKVNIGIIYLNNRSKCSKLSFFKICDNGKIKCSLGYLDLEGIKRMIDRKAIDRNPNGRSI